MFVERKTNKQTNKQTKTIKRTLKFREAIKKDHFFCLSKKLRRRHGIVQLELPGQALDLLSEASAKQLDRVGGGRFLGIMCLFCLIL